jgi:hypothetical protein
MIDLMLLRKNPDETMALIHKKDPSFDIKKLYELDSVVRQNCIRQAIKRKRSGVSSYRSGVQSSLPNMPQYSFSRCSRWE